MPEFRIFGLALVFCGKTAWKSWFRHMGSLGWLSVDSQPQNPELGIQEHVNDFSMWRQWKILNPGIQGQMPGFRIMGLAFCGKSAPKSWFSQGIIGMIFHSLHLVLNKANRIWQNCVWIQEYGTVESQPHNPVLCICYTCTIVLASMFQDLNFRRQSAHLFWSTLYYFYPWNDIKNMQTTFSKFVAALRNQK